MTVKTYGIYDAIQEEYVRTFNASNDEDAKRASSYIVKEKGFDDKAGKDRSVHFLYAFDSSTGKVVDNNVHLVANLASFIEERKREEMEIILRQKLATDDFINQIKSEVIKTIKGEIAHERTEESA